MTIAIVGSRDYRPLSDVEEFVATLEPGTVVVSGGARGVDLAAEIAARERGLKVISIPADWKQHGKRAGAIRNQQIVSMADRVVAFWDGGSRGTQITMRMADQAGSLWRVRVNGAWCEPVPGKGALRKVKDVGANATAR